MVGALWLLPGLAYLLVKPEKMHEKTDAPMNAQQRPGQA